MLKTLSTIVLSAITLSAALPEGMSFTPYGMAQYRLRYEILSQTKSDISTSSGTYSNLVGYKVGLKATLNQQVSAQFEIGNDWGSTEAADASTWNYLNTRGKLFPYFSLAYAKWDPGYMHIEAGIIPVKGTSMMDILGVQLYPTKDEDRLKKASHTPWIASTNGSMQGLRIGAPIAKGDFKFGIDLTTSIIKQRSQAAAEDFKTNKDAIMIGVDFPIAIKGLSLTPQFLAIPYKNYDKKAYESDHEFMGGIEGNYKINDGVSFKFGYGFAAFAQNVIDTVTSLDTVNKSEIAMNAGVGSTIKAGPGKLDVEFRFGSYENTNVDESLVIYPFVDLKYGITVNKYFTIMPRLRLFISSYSNDDVEVKTRPELMLTGSF